ARTAVAAEVRLYERLFTVADPDDSSDGKSYADHINRDSKRVVSAWLEPAAGDIPAEASVQFERLGYFTADRHDHAAGKPVFNRTATLRDSYAKR
ncbi:MAG: glutamine--tRNA ligase, partial [Dokdonella sp.]